MLLCNWVRSPVDNILAETRGSYSFTAQATLVGSQPLSPQVNATPSRGQVGPLRTWAGRRMLPAVIVASRATAYFSQVELHAALHVSSDNLLRQKLLDHRFGRVNWVWNNTSSGNLESQNQHQSVRNGMGPRQQASDCDVLAHPLPALQRPFPPAAYSVPQHALPLISPSSLA